MQAFVISDVRGGVSPRFPAPLPRLRRGRSARRARGPARHAVLRAARRAEAAHAQKGAGSGKRKRLSMWIIR